MKKKLELSSTLLSNMNEPENLNLTEESFSSENEAIGKQRAALSPSPEKSPVYIDYKLIDDDSIDKGAKSGDECDWEKSDNFPLQKSVPVI